MKIAALLDVPEYPCLGAPMPEAPMLARSALPIIGYELV
jgi:hypothetical protein